MGADVVEKMAVVRHHDHRARVIHQKILEPADGRDVQAVRRLVQQNDVRLPEQGLRQQDLDLLAPRERAHPRLEKVGGKAEPLQDLSGFRLRIPAVHFGKLRFQPGRDVSILLGKILFGVKGILLLRHPIQPRVALQHGIEHGEGLKGIVVLPQHGHAQLRVDRHFSPGRLQLPGKDLQEGGLPGAVCADHPVAVARGEKKVDMGKQVLPVEAQTQIRYCNHKFPP